VGQKAVSEWLSESRPVDQLERGKIFWEEVNVLRAEVVDSALDIECQEVAMEELDKSQFKDFSGGNVEVLQMRKIVFHLGSLFLTK
jgi:hypothetical protein